MCGQIPADERKVFDAVTLTDNYTGNTSGAIETRTYGKFTLIPTYAQGAAESGNTAELEVAFSANGTDWSLWGVWVDPGTGQLTERTYYYNITDVIAQPIVIEALARYIRIRVKEEGVAANAGTFSLYMYSMPLQS